MNIGFDVSFIKNKMNDIEYELICMLEINVNNGIFVENGMPIHIDGKSICYPKIETNGVPDRYSINYDPFMNRKVAHFLFNRYAVIRQMEDESFRIVSFFISKYLNNPNMLYATCRTNRGDFTSQPFTNESICWINLIYIMENGCCDYNLFSNIDNQVNLDRLLQQKEREEAKKK